MKKHLLGLLTVLWLVASTLGLGGLFVYENTPGTDTTSPITWPEKSQIPRWPSRPTLILFAHPKCPCTRASIGELAVLMAHCLNQVDVWVVFLRPAGTGEDWARTDLWRSAEAIPGVVVRADEEGRESRLFQVTTSGRALLYDTQGKLLFSGGITESRGHSGDNEGRSDLALLLEHKMAAGQRTPAFGCSLCAKTKGER
jgi:hypothetical protein